MAKNKKQPIMGFENPWHLDCYGDRLLAGYTEALPMMEYTSQAASETASDHRGTNDASMPVRRDCTAVREAGFPILAGGGVFAHVAARRWMPDAVEELPPAEQIEREMAQLSGQLDLLSANSRWRDGVLAWQMITAAREFWAVRRYQTPDGSAERGLYRFRGTGARRLALMTDGTARVIIEIPRHDPETVAKNVVAEPISHDVVGHWSVPPGILRMSPEERRAVTWDHPHRAAFFSGDPRCVSDQTGWATQWVRAWREGLVGKTGKTSRHMMPEIAWRPRNILCTPYMAAMLLSVVEPWASMGTGRVGERDGNARYCLTSNLRSNLMDCAENDWRHGGGPTFRLLGAMSVAQDPAYTVGILTLTPQIQRAVVDALLCTWRACVYGERPVVAADGTVGAAPTARDLTARKNRHPFKAVAVSNFNPRTRDFMTLAEERASAARRGALPNGMATYATYGMREESSTGVTHGGIGLTTIELAYTWLRVLLTPPSDARTDNLDPNHAIPLSSARVAALRKTCPPTPSEGIKRFAAQVADDLDTGGMLSVSDGSPFIAALQRRKCSFLTPTGQLSRVPGTALLALISVTANHQRTVQTPQNGAVVSVRANYLDENDSARVKDVAMALHTRNPLQFVRAALSVPILFSETVIAACAQNPRGAQGIAFDGTRDPYELLRLVKDGRFGGIVRRLCSFLLAEDLSPNGCDAIQDLLLRDAIAGLLFPAPMTDWWTKYQSVPE